MKNNLCNLLVNVIYKWFNVKTIALRCLIIVTGILKSNEFDYERFKISLMTVALLQMTVVIVS